MPKVSSGVGPFAGMDWLCLGTNWCRWESKLSCLLPNVASVFSGRDVSWTSRLMTDHHGQPWQDASQTGLSLGAFEFMRYMRWQGPARASQRGLAEPTCVKR